MRDWVAELEGVTRDARHDIRRIRNVHRIPLLPSEGVKSI
jgi:hypothetical protein